MPHIHEKIDFCVETFIVYHNQVLLRVHDKFDIWLGVGGHIELDENPNQAAIREVKEEVGLDVTLIGEARKWPEDDKGKKELIPPTFLHQHYVSSTHQHIALVYFAVAKNDRVVAESHDRSETWKWFREVELDDKQYEIQPHIIHYAKNALEAARKLIFV
ncbi:MAG: NUDIX domain-containing protein, partial [bacterium]|nr:NUDIX domain-containing protein [bacterium]